MARLLLRGNCTKGQWLFLSPALFLQWHHVQRQRLRNIPCGPQRFARRKHLQPLEPLRQILAFDEFVRDVQPSAVLAGRARMRRSPSARKIP